MVLAWNGYGKWCYRPSHVVYWKTLCTCHGVALPNISDTASGHDEPAIAVSKPTLKLMVWTDDNYAKVSEATHARWRAHEKFAERFAVWKIMNCEGQGADSTDPPPSKRLTAEPAFHSETRCIPLSALPSVLGTAGLPLDKDGMPLLELCAGFLLFLVNNSSTAKVLKAGSVLAGFYKGKLLKEGDHQLKPNAVPFQLAGTDGFVILGGKVIALGGAVCARMGSDPLKAYVRYHDKMEEPCDGVPGHFRLDKRVACMWRA